MSYSDESTGLASSENDTYTIMFSKCGLSSQTATCVEAPSRDYDLLSFLGIAQHLRIETLPIAWQPALDKLGLGGTAEIRQAHVKRETGFAFKLIKQAERVRWSERRIFQMLESEISVLRHPWIREHPNVISLEGICWEAAPDGQMWPVLVFKKAEFGNLKEFAESEIGQGMSFEDRCKLCASIAVAVRDMHMCQIIHGDIKPENVLIFKNRYGDCVAQVTDFGYSTLCAGQGLIDMPYSKGWTAPEWGQRGGFEFSDAKKMDAFSFGVLCLWFLFYTPRMDGDSSFRKDLELTSPTPFLASQTIMATTGLDEQQKRHICQLFELTLINNPAERSSDFNQFAQLLDIYSARVSHDMALLKDNSFQNYQNFRIVPSMIQLCKHHYGVRAYIIKCLENRATRSSLLPSQLAAFELAICCKLGFGIKRDDDRSETLLEDAKRSNYDLENEIKVAKSAKPSRVHRGGLYQDTAYEALVPPSSPAQYYLEHWQTHDAVRRLTEEIGDLETTLGPDHEVLLLLKFELSEFFKGQNNWERTEDLQTQIMKMTSRIRGQTHVDTCVIMSRLASTYYSQNRWEEAEKLLLQVKKSKLPPRHPVLLDSLQILALISAGQERWKEAEAMQLQIVQSRKSMLGLEHIKTLGSMNTLATIHKKRKRWREAEELDVQVTKAIKLVRGLDHAETLTSMSLTGLTFSMQERWKEAAELEMEVLQRTSKKFGPEHSETLSSMAILAIHYRKQGRLIEAEELHKQVAETKRRVLGPENSSTLQSLTNLALTFEAQDKWREAEELHNQVMKKTKEVVGSDNLDTMKSIAHLAGNYQGQKEWEKAEKLQQQVVQMSTAALGPKHAATLTHLHNLAAMLSHQKKWTETEKLQLQVMEMNLQVLGSNHPDTLSSMGWLARTYASQERWKEAEALQLQVLQATETVLGPQHSQTLLAKIHLAYTYKGQRRWKEAENLLVHLMNTNLVKFGQEHSYTLHSMHHLTLSYIKQERWDEAEELVVHPLNIRKRVLGLTNVHTLKSMTQLAVIYHGRGQLEVKEGLGAEVKISKNSSPVAEQKYLAILPQMPRSNPPWTAKKYREEALLLLSEVIAHSKEVLGSDHGATIARINRFNEWTTES